MKIQIALALVVVALTGCAQKNDTPEAIKQGVIRDISKRFKMDSMDVTVDSVSFRDKEADATVTYSPKGGSKDQGMTMKYLLERHSDNQWYIKSRTANQAPVSGGAGGGEAGAMPAGHPAIGGTNAGNDNGSVLPPSHPEVVKGQ